jgi:hypothetical protein
LALFKLYCILLTMFGSYNYSKKILTNFENHAKLLFINFGFFSDQFPRLRATSTTPSCFSTPLASRTLPPVDVLPEQPSRRCVTITSRQVLFCFVLFCFVLFCFVYVISQDLRLIFTLWYNYTKTSSVTIVWLFHLTQIESFKMFLDYFWRMLYWYFVMDSLTFSPFPKI